MAKKFIPCGFFHHLFLYFRYIMFRTFKFGSNTKHWQWFSKALKTIFHFYFQPRERNIGNWNGSINYSVECSATTTRKTFSFQCCKNPWGNRRGRVVKRSSQVQHFGIKLFRRKCSITQQRYFHFLWAQIISKHKTNKSLLEAIPWSRKRPVVDGRCNWIWTFAFY